MGMVMDLMEVRKRSAACPGEWFLMDVMEVMETRRNHNFHRFPLFFIGTCDGNDGPIGHHVAPNTLAPNTLGSTRLSLLPG